MESVNFAPSNWLMHCVLKSMVSQTYILKSRMGLCSGILAFWLSGRVYSSLGLDFLIWIMASPLSRMKVANINNSSEDDVLSARCRYQQLRTYLLTHHGLVNILYFYDVYSVVINNLPQSHIQVIQSLMLIKSPYFEYE